MTVVLEEFAGFTSLLADFSVDNKCFELTAHKLFSEYGGYFSLEALERMQKLIGVLVTKKQQDGQAENKERKEKKKMTNKEDYFAFCQDCIAGNTPKVSEFLTKHADYDIDQLDYKQGFAPLLWAASKGHHPVVKLLLDAGANPDVASPSGLTCMVSAAKSGYVATCKVLIERGAKVDEYGGACTPFLRACQAGQPGTAKLMFEHGADVRRREKAGGYSGITYACGHGHVAVVRFLIEEAGVGVEECDGNGLAPLGAAARSGKVELMDYLYKHGATNLENKAEDGWVPLINAVNYRQAATMNWLLQKGVDVNAQCPYGTSLHLAYSESIPILVQKGAKVDAYNREGLTPLQRFADRTGQVEGREEACMEALLQNGADVNKKSRTGITALHLACKIGNPKRVQLLLQHGADKTIVSDMDGLLPLGYASSAAMEELLVGEQFVELLVVAANNDPEELKHTITRIATTDATVLNNGDKTGNTPLMIAALHQEVNNVKLLQQNGARASVLNTRGHSPLLWALWHQNAELKKALEGSDPSEADKNGIAAKESWVKGLKGNPGDVYANSQLLGMHTSDWINVHATVSRSTRMVRGRDRAQQVKEGSDALGERMNDVPRTTTMTNFIPDGWKPTHRSFLDWLVEIGQHPNWNQRATNPEMCDIIWEGKKMVWWKVAECLDLAPIHTFACFCYTFESDICYSTNRAMRVGDKDEIEFWRPVIYWVSRALEALPPLPTGKRLLRGIRMPEVDWEQYSVGTELTWGAFSSTSLAYKVASFFLRGQKGLIFDVRGADCGRLLSPFSQFPMEEEVVLPPNTVVRVESIHRSGWRMLAVGDAPLIDIVAAKREPKESFVIKLTVIKNQSNKK